VEREGCFGRIRLGLGPSARAPEGETLVVTPSGTTRGGQSVERHSCLARRARERGREVGRRDFARGPQHVLRQLVQRILGLGQSAGQRITVAAGEEVEDNRRPPPVALFAPGGRQDQPALEPVCGSADAFSLVGDEVGQVGAADRVAGEQRFGHVTLERRELLVAEVVRSPTATCERVERGQRTQRDERGATAEVLPGADEPLLGQVVLPPPDLGEVGREVDEAATVFADRPVDVLAAREPFPKRGQDEVVVRIEDGQADAVDPRRGAADRGDSLPSRRR
jgi:hypothetical protein